MCRKVRFRPEPARPMRKVRIICDDPDATDSSDDEGAAREKKIKRIVHQVLYPISKLPSVKRRAPADRMNNGSKKTYSPPHETSPFLEPLRFRGVRKRKWGNMGSRNPPPHPAKAGLAGNLPYSRGGLAGLRDETDGVRGLARSVVVSTHVESRNNKKMEDCDVSNDSSIASHGSPSSDSTTLVKSDNGKVENLIYPDQTSQYEALSDELKELALVGSEMDLHFELDLLGVEALDDFTDDLPICDLEVTDNLMEPLPDLDFGFNMDAYNEALDWIDHVSACP